MGSHLKGAKRALRRSNLQQQLPTSAIFRGERAATGLCERHEGTIVNRPMSFSRMPGFGRLCLVLVAAVALLATRAVTAADAPGPGGTTSESEPAQRIRELVRLSPSFDAAPVYFYINDALFAVPRNLIVRMPEHAVGDAREAVSPNLLAASSRVTLHAMLPDMAGLTETNAECYLRGSGCDRLVRIIITEETSGSTFVRRNEEKKYYKQWGAIRSKLQPTCGHSRWMRELADDTTWVASHTTHRCCSIAICPLFLLPCVR